MSVKNKEGKDIKVAELKKKIVDGKSKEVLSFLQTLEPKKREEVHWLLIRFFEQKYMNCMKPEQTASHSQEPSQDTAERTDSQSMSLKKSIREKPTKEGEQKRVGLLDSELGNAPSVSVIGKYVWEKNINRFS